MAEAAVISSAGRAASDAGAFEYVFPAICGVQAGHVFYISMCPLRLIPKVFLFDEEELVPELRAQRVLNKARLPEMARYMVNNRESYVFSALTASIDAEVRFEPLEDERIGRLRVPMGARFIINDGQHRRAAIELALREDPSLADESIAVVFFLDVGLDRCQQMFADLNRYAIRPSKSLGVLYDHRDEVANLSRRMVLDCPVFKGVVETERSTLSPRSRKLFTLSALYGATRELLAGVDEHPLDARADAANAFWAVVAEQFPEWEAVRQSRLSAGEVRRDFIHSHGIVLTSLGRVGNTLARRSLEPASWERVLRRLRGIDWTRSNSALWEGRAMIAGRVSKNAQNVTLTTNAIRMHLKQPLSPEEQRVEEAFNQGDGHG
jgi:DNA sulfur modification protein DndB